MKNFKNTLTSIAATLALSTAVPALATDTPIEDIRAMYPGKQVERLFEDRDIFLVTSFEEDGKEMDTWANILSDRNLVAIRLPGQSLYRLKQRTTFGSELSNDIDLLEQLANQNQLDWAFGNCNPNEVAPWLTYTCFNVDFTVPSVPAEPAVTK